MLHDLLNLSVPMFHKLFENKTYGHSMKIDQLSLLETEQDFQLSGSLI